MLIVPSAVRSYAELYLVSPIFEWHAKAIWARAPMLMTPSWFTSGSLDMIQLAVSVDTLTLHAAPSQEVLVGMASTQLLTESEAELIDTVIVLEKKECPV